MLRKIREQKWFNAAAAACIAVAFYVFLTNVGSVLAFAGRFIGYFRTLIIGFVFAYMLTPVAKFFYYRLFTRLKSMRFRWVLAVICTMFCTLIILILLIGTLIPQLLQSVLMLTGNYQSYIDTLEQWLVSGPFRNYVGDGQISDMAQNAISSVMTYVQENTGSILSRAASSGKNILSGVISLILAIYLLLDKKRFMKGRIRLMKLIFPPDVMLGVLDYFLHVDTILKTYMWQTILDGLIIGIANAVFMTVCGMQFTGLISVVVGVTNLIPNFGPLIGGVIGAFILLLVNPWHAVLFVGCCFVLQFMDAFVLKPKLFADSMGVSGLTILSATIVLGNMFGFLGILLSIPAAAVISFTFRDYIIPARERQLEEREKNR